MHFVQELKNADIFLWTTYRQFWYRLFLIFLLCMNFWGHIDTSNLPCQKILRLFVFSLIMLTLSPWKWIIKSVKWSFHLIETVTISIHRNGDIFVLDLWWLTIGFFRLWSFHFHTSCLELFCHCISTGWCQCWVQHILEERLLRQFSRGYNTIQIADSLLVW